MSVGLDSESVRSTERNNGRGSEQGSLAHVLATVDPRHLVSCSHGRQGITEMMRKARSDLLTSLEAFEICFVISIQTSVRDFTHIVLSLPNRSEEERQEVREMAQFVDNADYDGLMHDTRFKKLIGPTIERLIRRFQTEDIPLDGVQASA